MSIIANQVTVGTTATLLLNVPGGPTNTVITVSSGTIFLGTSNSVTVNNGAHIISGVPWQVLGYATSRPVTLYAIASPATGVGIVLSTTG
jgi:hypothetical protein